MLTDFNFKVQVRVRFVESDAQGIVNNGAYMTYLEVGRIEFFRKAGISIKDRTKYGVDFVLVEAWIQYKSPARVDDLLNIHVRIKEIKERTFTMEYEITDSEDNDRLIAKAYTISAVIDPKIMKSCPIPENIKGMIKSI
ncbi:MAG: acyl-CoA thioesterase [Deltaproteobacteria bacterium]|nr:acyl-CoA thioesterase [Deltaproteobacteria bacterium]